MALPSGFALVAPLARMEARIMLRALLDRLPVSTPVENAPTRAG